MRFICSVESTTEDYLTDEVKTRIRQRMQILCETKRNSTSPVCFHLPFLFPTEKGEIAFKNQYCALENVVM